MHDQLFDGTRPGVLNVMDGVTRECLASDVTTLILGERMAREFARVVSVHSRLAVIVSDTGTELTSNAVLSWAREAEINWLTIVRSKPTQTAESRAVPATHAGRALEGDTAH